MILSRGGHSSRVTVKQSYAFAIILGIILLALIIIFNIRDEEIEKTARSLFGNPQ
jgi:tetrahydromethanopterin S-methyltransferase subunit E